MRFKIDENLPVEVAMLLREHGFDAMTADEQGLAGSPDPQLSQVCCQEGRVLITLDLGFANILAYPPADSPGFIVLRLEQQDKPRILELVGRLAATLSDHRPEKQLWLVPEHQIRIRA